MAVSANTRVLWAQLMAVRAALMLITGLFAVIFPGIALTVLVVLGGALLVVDGALGLWSLTFGGARTGNYWFDVARNALGILVGALILISPLMATILTVTVLVYIFAFQAILVGGMEIYLIIRERENYARIWPVLLSGALYILFGLALLFWPLVGAITFVIIGGVLMILFSIALFALAWRMYKATKAN